MNINKVSSRINSAYNNFSSYIGKGIAKHQDNKKFSNLLKTLEPTNSNNSFITMAAIMLGGVLAPRIITASKRNPDNKEATKDEITEILFRDVQTIIIMLFGLKSLNTIIGSLSTKASGIPMINKPFKQLFSSDVEGIKAKANDVLEHPIEKLKTIGKNILSMLNPKGTDCLTGEDIIKRYTNYNSIGEIQKFITDLPNNGGDQNKVFNTILDAIIKQQDELIEANSKTKVFETGEITSSAKSIVDEAKQAKKYFTELKEKGYEYFLESEPEDIPKGGEQLLIDFFKNKKNPLVQSANRLNAGLRTLALGIEAGYLGFGLPALNQRRLEKKYLSAKPIGVNRGDTFTPINDKHVKAQEIQLYSDFIK